ncbi:hypothetical protein RNZ50_15350 [Paracoccaceae bacterium Fryx2]|nr:hypothetical protein [Paracoccaceae bacterium Fryx2]
MGKRWGIGFGLVLALAAPALAQDPPGLYPAGLCAAFWQGRIAYAESSALLGSDPTDRSRAARFRDAALRLSGAGEDAVDAYIAERREMMVGMFDAMIAHDDAESRALHDRLAQTCASFGETQPETRGFN